jgi:threonine dehydrogenase-like Zn-dependent dehydrogenase
MSVRPLFVALLHPMPAIVARRGSREPNLVSCPLPRDPREGEVLCETLELGVCGTDREILHSAQPWTPEGEEILVLGHECLARVLATGSGVTELHVGDIVVPVVRRKTALDARRVDLLPFGNAFIERGIYRAHGFSSARWLDRPEFLYRVPKTIESIAVFTEPLTVAEKGINEALAIQRGRLGPDAWNDSPPRVLVTGLGPIAFAGVIACVARDWPVTVWGRDRADTFRARLAQDFGAEYRSEPLQSLDAQAIEREGYDLALECTGSDDVMLAAAASLRSCGVMCWLGSVRIPEPASHNVAKLMRDGLVRNHAYVGCVNAAPRDFEHALAHLQQLYAPLRRELDALITARVPPEESLWHYVNRQPQGIKTVIHFGD